MSDSMDAMLWYAIQTRPRHEKMVAFHLNGKGFEHYLPVYKMRRRWSDRSKDVEFPLFPGYIFCKFDLNKRLPILVIPGVLSLVGCGAMPISIPQSEISAVERVVASGLPYGPWPTLNRGDRVRVRYGPLRDLEGVIVDVRNASYLLISVPLLGRSVSVLIDPTEVVPAGRAPARPVPQLAQTC